MSPLLAKPVAHDDVGTVFARVGTELAALMAVSEDLQDLFGTMMSVNAGEGVLHADMLRSLQSLDLLTQTLDALSQFMTRLGDEPRRGGVLDLTHALHAVSLSALATRLSGLPADTDSDMEFDLF